MLIHFVASIPLLANWIWRNFLLLSWRGSDRTGLKRRKDATSHVILDNLYLGEKGSTPPLSSPKSLRSLRYFTGSENKIVRMWWIPRGFCILESKSLKVSCNGLGLEDFLTFRCWILLWPWLRLLSLVPNSESTVHTFSHLLLWNQWLELNESFRDYFSYSSHLLFYILIKWFLCPRH